MTAESDKRFHAGGTDLSFGLLDFWRWSAADLLSNAQRGVLAEFIVGQALGALDQPRTEWDAYDLLTPDGLKIEVKSSAYLQSWPQDQPSKITYGIAPTLGWDARTNTYGTEKKRQADVYVFCLLDHMDPVTVDPMDLGQWRFWVVPTSELDEQLGEQKTLAVSRLRELAGENVSFSALRSLVAQVPPRQR